jgi:hypothetical protein
MIKTWQNKFREGGFVSRQLSFVGVFVFSLIHKGLIQKNCDLPLVKLPFLHLIFPHLLLENQ